MADSIGEVVLGISVEQAGAQQALQDFGKTAEKEANRAANSIDNLKQKLKEQQQQLSQLEIGSKQFQSLRQEIAQTEAALKSATLSPLQAERQAQNERLAAAKRLAAQQAQIERERFQASVAALKRLNEAEKAAAKEREQIAKQEEDRRIESQKRLQGILGTAVGALGVGISAAAGVEFLRQSVQSAVELETVTRKLTNSLGEQGAAGALAFTRGLSDELGLSFKTLVGTFSSFTAAATAAGVPLQQQKDLFAAVSKAAQQLGLSDDELQGSLLALQQVASKGVVQMEELRGQLGERLPIAFAAAAKGLGKTQQELIALVESGKLTANEFFPALTKGLNQLSSSGGAPTAAQEIGKLSNAIEQLKTDIGEGLLPALVPAVNGLRELVRLAVIFRNLPKAEPGRVVPGFANPVGPQADKIISDIKSSDLAAQAYAKTLKYLQEVTKEYDASKPLAALDDTKGKANAAAIAAQQQLQIERERAVLAEKTANINAKNNADNETKGLQLSQSRLAITQQISQAEQQLAEAKLTTEGAVLDAQEKRALKGVENERTKAAIEEQFARKREELELRQLALKQQAILIEQRGQLESLRLEGQITALAAKRQQIAAQIELTKASAGKDPAQVQAAQAALDLAKQEVSVVDQINREKISGAQRAHQLQLQLLEQQKQQALADNQYVTSKSTGVFLDATRKVVELEPTPFRENSKAVTDSAANISTSNTALIDRVGNLQSAIDQLSSKDWSVQVYVQNQAGGASTVNTQNRLQ